MDFRLSSINKTAEGDDAENQKNQHHPRGGNISKPADGLEAEGGTDSKQKPRHHNGGNPPPTGRRGVVKAGHLEPEPDAQSSRRNSYHGTGKNGEHRAVGQIIGSNKFSTADFLKLIIQRQSGPRCNGSTKEHPAENSQSIADKQTDNQVKGPRPMSHKQRPKHQFCARRMLAGIHPKKTLKSEQRTFGHGPAFKFISRMKTALLRGRRNRRVWLAQLHWNLLSGG